MTPGLPHHRWGPRIDERRTDPGDERAISFAVAVGYTLGLCLLIGFSLGVIR